MGRDLLIVIWFVVVMLAFYGVYLGIALSVPLLQATYSLFLILSLSGMVLTLLGRLKKQVAEKGEEIRAD